MFNPYLIVAAFHLREDVIIPLSIIMLYASSSRKALLNRFIVEVNVEGLNGIKINFHALCLD